MCGKRVLRMSARILVPANDVNPVAIADYGVLEVPGEPPVQRYIHHPRT